MHRHHPSSCCVIPEPHHAAVQSIRRFPTISVNDSLRLTPGTRRGPADGGAMLEYFPCVMWFRSGFEWELNQNPKGSAGPRRYGKATSVGQRQHLPAARFLLTPYLERVVVLQPAPTSSPKQPRTGRTQPAAFQSPHLSSCLAAEPAGSRNASFHLRNASSVEVSQVSEKGRGLPKGSPAPKELHEPPQHGYHHFHLQKLRHPSEH